MSKKKLAYKLFKLDNNDWQDREFLRFFEDVDGIVEATHEEQFGCYLMNDLWSKGRKWEQINPGRLITAGEFGGMPVSISMSKVRVGETVVMFYESPSLVTHWDLVRDWLQAHLPEAIYNNRSDAANWVHVLK